MISAGDGTPPATAIPANSPCAGRTPQVFTYTYWLAGTYPVTLTNATTEEVLQTVTVTVSAGYSNATTTAILDVAPPAGIAPLLVTFTATDTSPACPHPPIMISAGDGTASAVAIPVNTSTSCDISPQELTYKYKTAGTYQATLTNAATEEVLQTVTVTVAPDTANARLDAVPSSGPAPLTVKFTVTDTSASCPRAAISLMVGDRSLPVTALSAASVCTGINPVSFNYVYRIPGTYRAEIANMDTKKVLQAVNIAVTPEAPYTPASVGVTTVSYGASAVNVSPSLLNLSGVPANTPANTAVARPATIQASTFGDILVSAAGVTIIGGGHDTDGRTGVSGFFGYDPALGVDPQTRARQLCNARPWGSSSATSIIPPSFFDSICNARGYKASAVSNPPAASQNAQTPAKTATTTSAGPTVPPEVYIKAVPAIVKIGSRTSIFWNAVGVKSCLLTSPDGSFSGNTLKGAASTVPITADTVFSIACIKPDNSQISNSVKVKIEI